MVKVFVVLIVVWMGLGCAGEPPERMVLFDFESEADLDRMHWQCFTLFELSSEQATQGERSLKMTLHPSPYPGWSAKLDRNDWRGYGALVFDVHNPQSAVVPITVRIDDRVDYPAYGERYNQQFELAPGGNQVVIGFDSLVTSGSRRPLDLRRIYRFMFFMAGPEERYVLYLDHVRLTR